MKFTNYRPVSVLAVLSNVLERLVYNRLLKFIDKYKILYLYQFGFHQKHSTFMALSSFIDRITEYTEMENTPLEYSWISPMPSVQ